MLNIIFTTIFTRLYCNKHRSMTSFLLKYNDYEMSIVTVNWGIITNIQLK